LPTWLGWAAIVIGILTAAPAGLLGIVALIFWTATISVLVFRREDAGAPSQSLPA
jgi:hypothetical protein